MNKILIVDDDRHFIQRIRTLLTGFGYTVPYSGVGRPNHGKA